MTLPEIRYARANDGLPLGFWTMGSGPGPPLVMVPPGSSNIEGILRVDRARAWYERLAQGRTVVAYARRGAGLSGRPSEAAGWDLAFHVQDIGSIVDHLHLGEVDLLASWHASRWVPEWALSDSRARRLVIWNPNGTGLGPSRLKTLRGRALDAVRAVGDMDLWLSNMSLQMVKQTPELLDEAIELYRGFAGPDEWDAFQAGALDSPNLTRIDYSSVLNPTLLLQGEDIGFGKEVEDAWAAEAKGLASRMPNSRFRSLRNVSGELALTPISIIEDVIEPFLDEDSLVEAALPATAFRTILFTDVVASTPLLAQLKDEKMRAVMRDHDEVLEAAVTDNGGRVVKTIGDAFMAEFAVPSGAVEAAIAAQRGIRDKFADSDVPIRLRIGINAGEPIEEDGDLHGASVVIAKRLESEAENGGILVSDVVRSAVAGKEFEFVDRGEGTLKGFDEPVRAWSVQW